MSTSITGGLADGVSGAGDANRVLRLGDPQQTLADLSDQASRMEPPLRLTPTVVQVAGKPIIVFEK